MHKNEMCRQCMSEHLPHTILKGFALQQEKFNSRKYNFTFRE